MEHSLADACAAEPEPSGDTGGPSAGSGADEPAATVTTKGLSWKAAALQWKAEANALRAENERLTRAAHAFLGVSKVSPLGPSCHCRRGRRARLDFVRAACVNGPSSAHC